jgi:hypothetical protein
MSCAAHSMNYCVIQSTARVGSSLLLAQCTAASVWQFSFLQFALLVLLCAPVCALQR